MWNEKKKYWNLVEYTILKGSAAVFCSATRMRIDHRNDDSAAVINIGKCRLRLSFFHAKNVAAVIEF